MKTVAGQCNSVLLGFDVLPRDFQSTLETARLDVIAGYFRDQSHLHILPAIDGGGDTRVRSLYGAPRAAKHIQLPRSVKSRLVNVVAKRNARRQKWSEQRLVCARSLTGIGARWRRRSARSRLPLRRAALGLRAHALRRCANPGWNARPARPASQVPYH